MLAHILSAHLPHALHAAHSHLGLLHAKLVDIAAVRVHGAIHAHATAHSTAAKLLGAAALLHRGRANASSAGLQQRRNARIHASGSALRRRHLGADERRNARINGRRGGRSTTPRHHLGAKQRRNAGINAASAHHRATVHLLSAPAGLGILRGRIAFRHATPQCNVAAIRKAHALCHFAAAGDVVVPQRVTHVSIAG